MSYRNDEVEERLQPSLLSRGVLLNLKNIYVYILIVHGSAITLRDMVLIITPESIFTFH